MFTTIPIGDKPFVSPYFSVGREVCKNLYIEQSPSETAKVPYYAIRIPGFRATWPQTRTGSAGCRGLFTTSDGRTFAANGSTLWELYQNGSRIARGTLSSTSGPVRFAENGFQVCIVDGKAGYILELDTSILTAITDEYFPGVLDPTAAPTHVKCLDGYFIVNKALSYDYYWSTLFYQPQAIDPSAPLVMHYWNGLQFGKKVGDTDNILALDATSNLLFLFGRNSCEVHYDTGDVATQLWARMPNAIIQMGIASKDAHANYQGVVYWLGSDRNGTVGVFGCGSDFQPKRVSTRGIEQIIQSFAKYDDCRAYVYAQAGHAFVIFHFLNADRTLAYDVVTGAWHERTYLDRETGLEHRWRGEYATENWSMNIFGDGQTDAYYWLDVLNHSNENPDGIGVNYIKWVKTTPIGFKDGRWVRYKSAQIMMQQGNGTTLNTDEGVGQDPSIMLAYSNDSGKTWSQERLVKTGRQGQYAYRSLLPVLGSSRNRVWRISGTDPVETILVGLLIDGDVLAR